MIMLYLIMALFYHLEALMSFGMCMGIVVVKATVNVSLFFGCQPAFIFRAFFYVSQATCLDRGNEEHRTKGKLEND